jgi:aminoglycoside phosphotransferase (APT) family kinase protein
MVREHRILAALTQTDVPVPAPIALYESADLTGAPFYVMEHVAGYVVTDLHSAEALAADARDHVGPSLTAALAKLHAVDVDAVGLGDLGRRNGYVERQLQRWTRQWDASKTREIPAIDRLATRLSAAIPQQQDVALVHGDYRLDNLVVGNDGEVRAVLDWELCTLGDPLADVGLLLAYWPQASARPTEFLTPEQVIEAYARASGRDVTNVPFFHALGYWKLAVIVQGVYRRLVDHPTSGSDDPTKLAPLVDQLAERAELTAHKAGL